MSVIPVDFLTRAGSRMHEPFLERASEAGNRFRSHALGAFLTMRAIDRIAEPSRTLASDALGYQLKAASSYLDELHPQNEEVSHLREIIRVAQTSCRVGNRQLLWAPMLAFSFWLEQQLRLNESLDVLETLVRMKSEALDERIAAHLQRGRVLRMVGRFTESTTAYATAGEMANLSGDWRSEMVSRIGRAGVLQKTGDLPRADSELRSVLAAAAQRQDSFVEARASHALAVNMHQRNRPAEAAVLAFRAFELYEEAPQRLRALNDTGVFLKDLGHYSASRDAFHRLLDQNPAPELRVLTVLELLELTSIVSDRVGFARWRRDLENQYDSLPPDQQVEFEIKLGAGLAVFAAQGEAINRLKRAIAMAERYKLGQRVFEAETILNEVRAGKTTPVASPPITTETDFPELQPVFDGLLALGQSPVGA